MKLAQPAAPGVNSTTGWAATASASPQFPRRSDQTVWNSHGAHGEAPIIFIYRLG
jgi:hypothetical protein